MDFLSLSHTYFMIIFELINSDLKNYNKYYCISKKTQINDYEA